MGGRLDAVNAVSPNGSLITSIGLDHCAWLGEDRESIATEKAGIMRAGIPTVFGSPDMPAAIVRAADETGASLLVAGRDYSYEQPTGERSVWTWRGSTHSLEDLRVPSLPGAVQLQNAAAVLTLIEMLGMDHLLDRQIVNGALGDIDLPGRFQVIDGHPRWIIDVAHNPDAGATVGELLEESGKRGRLTAIVGMLEDKNVEDFISMFSCQVDAWIAVTISGKRGGSAQPLAQTISNASGKACMITDNLSDAFQLADSRSADEDTILVTGSFYIAGPALEWLAGNCD
jgi:dihydrofolate synthase/folylpolyglutamate synthase